MHMLHDDGPVCRLCIWCTLQVALSLISSGISYTWRERWGVLRPHLALPVQVSAWQVALLLLSAFLLLGAYYLQSLPWLALCAGQLGQPTPTLSSNLAAPAWWRDNVIGKARQCEDVETLLQVFQARGPQREGGVEVAGFHLAHHGARHSVPKCKR